MKKFILSEAIETAKQLGIDFNEVKFTSSDFLEGMNIELEHGTINLNTNVTDDNPLSTGKIALAHLNEHYTYYNCDIGLPAWERAIEDFEGVATGKKIQIV